MSNLHSCRPTYRMKLWLSVQHASLYRIQNYSNVARVTCDYAMHIIDSSCEMDEILLERIRQDANQNAMINSFPKDSEMFRQILSFGSALLTLSAEKLCPEEYRIESHDNMFATGFLARNITFAWLATLACLTVQPSSVLSLNVGGNTKNATGKPNFVFIITDDQDLHLSSMDYMPLVQKHLAEQGTFYRRHYCTIAICCPSRVSLLTGRAAHNTNVTDVSPPYGKSKECLISQRERDWTDGNQVDIQNSSPRASTTNTSLYGCRKPGTTRITPASS